MKLYDQFKDVYVGELSLQEEKELAKFASALLKAKQNHDASAGLALIKQAAEEIHDPEDFDHMTSLAFFISSGGDVIGTGHTKQAKWDFDKKLRAADMVLKGGMLASAVAPLAAAAIKGWKGSSAYKKSYVSAMRDNPILAAPANLDQTKRNFETIKMFAPDVAKNPTVTSNILKRMHTYGPQFMDINAVKELASTQKDIASRRRDTQQNSLLKHVDDTISRSSAMVSDQIKAREGSELRTMQEANDILDQGLRAKDLQLRGAELGRKFRSEKEGLFDLMRENERASAVIKAKELKDRLG